MRFSPPHPSFFFSLFPTSHLHLVPTSTASVSLLPSCLHLFTILPLPLFLHCLFSFSLLIFVLYHFHYLHLSSLLCVRSSFFTPSSSTFFTSLCILSLPPPLPLQPPNNHRYHPPSLDHFSPFPSILHNYSPTSPS